MRVDNGTRLDKENGSAALQVAHTGPNQGPNPDAVDQEPVQSEGGSAPWAPTVRQAFLH